MLEEGFGEEEEEDAGFEFLEEEAVEDEDDGSWKWSANVPNSSSTTLMVSSATPAVPEGLGGVGLGGL